MEQIKTIKECETEADFRNAFPVINELRPHLSEESYFRLLKPMQEAGYRLFVLEQDGEVIACAGIEVATNFYNGRHLYLHDLVTRSDCRSCGYGERLLGELEAWGREQGCELVSLTSRFIRKDAHRFYEERMGYDKESYVFLKEL
ncbi:Acetyltransferase (GNAT) family protein [Marininema mesophilum]|uniref:Acetyltransferase (GNAT) family protein n=1 Tax=Marininema mesophilum TaxID=1048340 RepID=A0A1H2YJD5_9BACL|nr:GNAT family N-acetyltransferase [Marininema mesophilum]SDX05190.1 Acetyltransferase (GNAT) family protein [Marininema mesophilum]